MAKCKGKAMWAFLTKTDDKYQPCWRITVCMDSTEAAKLIELGLKKQVKRIDPLTNPEEAELGEYKMKFVRYLDKRGAAVGKNPAPALIDADNEPFTDIVGNGSDVVVKFRPYTWANKKFGTGVGADLEAVKVINLKPYEPKVTDGQEEETATVGADTDDDKW